MDRNNSLNTVRLLAAIQVMWGHMVFHLEVPDVFMGGISIQGVISTILSFMPGVPVFFFLSGFLISNSVNRENEAVKYYIKRFFRIYPELWVAIIFEIFSILIFYKKRLAITTLLLFAITQGTVLQFWTPDGLRDYGCGTPNGSLWTIGIIVQFYILIWIIKRLKNGKLFIGIEMILLFVGVLTPWIESKIPELAYKLYMQTIIPYFWIFGLGIIVSEHWKTIEGFLKKYWFLFVIAYILSVMFIQTDLYAGKYPVLRTLITSLGALGIAFSFPQLNVKWDISYEMYILHMIIVNILISAEFVGVLGMIAASLLTIMIASLLYIFNRKYLQNLRNIWL